jgi:uncharacterized protein YecE (DUF72 family)
MIRERTDERAVVVERQPAGSRISLRVGTAGWNLRREWADQFASKGTHLQRYADRFNAVEINTSFYRPHRITTYQRWAASTPADFHFSVKMPKQITHELRLKEVELQVEQFIAEASGLSEKLGVILIQLPPSLEFVSSIARIFFRTLRAHTEASLVCEPRHPSWFETDAESVMAEYAIGRVAADPAIIPAAAQPSGCQQHVYFRWHGSPRTYYSSYDAAQLDDLARRMISLSAEVQQVWCIFDNTAEGAATMNALELNGLLQRNQRALLL